jgi:hypothetical protein
LPEHHDKINDQKIMEVARGLGLMMGWFNQDRHSKTNRQLIQPGEISTLPLRQADRRTIINLCGAAHPFVPNRQAPAMACLLSLPAAVQSKA